MSGAAGKEGAAVPPLTERLSPGGASARTPRPRTAGVAPVASPVAAPAERAVVRSTATAVLASPAFCVAAGLAVFLMAWLFPPSTFARLVGDRQYLFLDLKSVALVGGCVLSLAAGLFAGTRGADSHAGLRCPSPLAEVPATRAAMLAAMIVLQCGAVVLFLRSGAGGAMAAAMNSGEGMREGLRDLRASGVSRLWLTALLPSTLLLPVVFQIWRTSTPRSLVRWACVAVAVTFAAAVFVASRRNFVARPLFAVVLLTLVWRYADRPRGVGRAALVLAGSAAAVLVAFFAMAWLRFGDEALDRAGGELSRYLFAPYNNQAAMLDGALRFPGSHAGYYWGEFLWRFPVFSDLLPVEEWRRSVLGPASPVGALERGPYLKAAGLGAATSLPAFASSFHDFGWLAPLPFFPLGLVAGRLWRAFLRGGVAGIVFYPLFAYSCVEWRANLIFPSQLVAYAVLAWGAVVLASAVESACRRPAAAHHA